MSERVNPRTIRLALVGAVLIAIVWLGFRTLEPGPPPPPSVPLPPDTAATGLEPVRLYFAAASAESLVSESRELPLASSLHERVTALVAELDAGPRGAGVTALPAGTSVLHCYLDDRGLMTLDLSRAFEQGFRGGSTTEYFAIASLVRTLSANLPEVRRVLLVCGGAPIATLGGHVPLDRPLDVNDWP